MFASLPDAWPSVPLASVPSLRGAEVLAIEVRRATATPPEARQDLSALLEIGRFALGEESLSARGGGIEAALAPRPGNRFALIVDSEPRGGWDSVSPGLREDLARHRLRFRVAHEIGHSFFYDRHGDSPRRLVFDSVEQERWCDRFASALLLPPSAVTSCAATPRALTSLQARFDVSMQVVARAFARMHRDRFVALLVARGRRPPYVRIQWQKSHCAPAPRWWTARELQSALTSRRCAGTVVLAWPGGERTAAWDAMPARQQILVLA